MATMASHHILLSLKFSPLHQSRILQKYYSTCGVRFFWQVDDGTFGFSHHVYAVCDSLRAYATVTQALHHKNKIKLKVPNRLSFLQINISSWMPITNL